MKACYRGEVHRFPGRWLFSLGLLVSCENPEAAELDEGWSGTPPSEPAALGEPCESTWIPCVDGAFCDASPESVESPCGEVGVCVAQPLACDESSNPVCGCDGELYANSCEAAKAGVGTRGAQGCEPPAGTQSCGSSFCALDSEYCEYVIGHGQSAAWRCLPLVCLGALEGCECLSEPLCGVDADIYGAEYCQETDDGATVVVCVPY